MEGMGESAAAAAPPATPAAAADAAAALPSSAISRQLKRMSSEGNLSPQEQSILQLYEATEEKRAVCLRQHAQQREKITSSIVDCKVTLQLIDRRRLELRQLRRGAGSHPAQLQALELRAQYLDKNEELTLRQLEELRKQATLLQRQRLDIMQMEEVRDSIIGRFLGSL